MNRQFNASDQDGSRPEIASRLQLVRTELFGSHGGPLLATRLGLPFRTWFNYESGVTVPGQTLLSFLVLTNTEPVWLLRGSGPMFRVAAVDVGAGGERYS